MSNLDPQILAQKKKMQIEIILKESDAKKYEREKLLLEVEIRALKSNIQQTQMEITSKESKLKHIQDQNMMLQNELIKLKHQMNSLH